MGEKITLYPLHPEQLNPRTGRTQVKKAYKATSVETHPLPRDRWGEDKLLHMLNLGGKKQIPMIERKIPSGTLENYIKTWEAFRAAGMPVVHYLRRGDGETLFAEYLKKDGSEIFGKAYAENASKPDQSSRPLSKMEEYFIRIMDEQFGDIQKALGEIRQKAKDHKLILPKDDPFEILIHPDGKWEIVILDLRYAAIGDDVGENEFYSTKTLERLVDLRDFLVKTKGKVFKA